MSQMHRGTIKFCNKLKGWGFITPDEGGRDVFFHIKQFSNPFEDFEGEIQYSQNDIRKFLDGRAPDSGLRVIYRELETNKGLMAHPWTYEDLWELFELAYEAQVPRHISEVQNLRELDLLADQMVSRMFR